MLKLLQLFCFLLLAPILKGQVSIDTAVNFTVKDVKGTTHYLSEYLEQGKMVVIDFFTITCGPCSTYAPLINESYKHFGCNTSNVVFLGINWGGDNIGVTDFGNTYGVQYPEISGTEGNGNHVVADYGVLSYPTVILILKDSYIREKYIWPPTTEHLDSIVEANGGILSGCYTPISECSPDATELNRIKTVFPIPADKIITCSTTVTSPCTLQVLALTGNAVSRKISVNPRQDIQFILEGIAAGYYVLILRNENGTVIDRKPILIVNGS
jgi:thiol-disulfide isomerase/thioredoxin